MRHTWSPYRTGQRCSRCKLRRRRVREVSFRTGRLQWWNDYKWPGDSWLIMARVPACVEPVRMVGSMRVGPGGQ